MCVEMAATVNTSAMLLFVICVGYLVCVQGSGCQGYGECGLNGICQVVYGASRCRCPAGFDFANPHNPSKGCFQRTSQQTKKCITSGAKMVNEGHIDWWGNDYETMTSVNQTACMQACLDDCFCTTVISANLDGTDYCWKKQLPLRDGRASSTRTAFVKVSRTTTCF